MSRVSLDDLLAAESEVLKKIAADLEGSSSQTSNMAGHHSISTGHNSVGTHSSHNSGVTSASVPPTKPEEQNS